MTCKGTGQVRLSPKLFRVLRSVARGNDSAKMVAMDLNYKGSTITAMNNALEDLRKLGLVTRRRMENNGKFVGNAWSYQAYE